SSVLLASSPFTIKKPTKYYPAFIAPRLRAQEGLFIVCATLESPLDDNQRNDWSIERMRIPASAKSRILYELFRLGIHASSLFPDLDGLTSRIRWSQGITSSLRDTSRDSW